VRELLDKHDLIDCKPSCMPWTHDSLRPCLS
jgi:hypothetical protein